uniref:t-SNARE coiled-coil homology domain-containing protein n=1 Tax=Chrysotila carterae TaxID=13221 RepID=A0A6S9R8C0_CHRCT
MPDPFEEVREDVSASLVGAQAQRARWERERSEESKHALLASMRHIDADLQEMTDALSAVERDRKRFAIDDAELRSRHAWIADARKQVEAHRAAVRAAETPSAKCCAKTGAVAAARRPAVTGDVASCGEAERDSLLPGGDGKKSAKGKGVKGVRQDAQLDPVVDAHTLQMTQMHAEQDEVLDALGGAVGNLRVIGGAMHEELRSQSQMLSDLDAQVDKTAGNLDFLKGKLKKLLPQKDRKQKFILVFLSIVLFVLIVLVVS